MQEDFHYYAAYSAAYIAGFSHEESLQIAYSDQLTDCCSRTFLEKLHGPGAAATTQLQMEMMSMNTDIISLQEITRIWASFHFLPRDLYAPCKGSKSYKNKYRLICGPNGSLLADTVDLAGGKGLPAAGLAMHILADTWAHQHFAGTPSLVINNTNNDFHELYLLPDKDLPQDSLQSENRKIYTEEQISFGHNPAVKDDIENRHYINTIYQGEENSVMNLGHGRAGHLPDYSFIIYKYCPAWGDYEEIIKNNPSDYYHAFCQMVYALKYLKSRSKKPDTGDTDERNISESPDDIYSTFKTGYYDFEAVSPWENEIRDILKKRQLIASDDWKAFGEKLSGQEIPDFDIEKYQSEYLDASSDRKNETFLGQYFLAAMSQKSMVTGKVFRSGNILAGFSVDYKNHRFRGIKDYMKLLENR